MAEDEEELARLREEVSAMRRDLQALASLVNQMLNPSPPPVDYRRWAERHHPDWPMPARITVEEPEHGLSVRMIRPA